MGKPSPRGVGQMRTRLSLFSIIGLAAMVATSGRVLSQSEDFSNQKYNDAKIAMQQGEWLGVIASCTSVIKITSDSGQRINCFYFRGYAQYKNGNCTGAVHDFQAMLKLNGTQKNAKQVQLADEIINECVQRQETPQGQPGPKLSNGAAQQRSENDNPRASKVRRTQVRWSKSDDFPRNAAYPDMEPRPDPGTEQVDGSVTTKHAGGICVRASFSIREDKRIAKFNQWVPYVGGVDFVTCDDSLACDVQKGIGGIYLGVDNVLVHFTQEDLRADITKYVQCRQERWTIQPVSGSYVVQFPYAKGSHRIPRIDDLASVGGATFDISVEPIE